MSPACSLPYAWGYPWVNLGVCCCRTLYCWSLHDVQLSLTQSSDTYTISGYAYGGGGIALTRVEVTLDDGKVSLAPIEDVTGVG